MAKTILISGASGWVGRHVADCFLQQGWRVRGLSRQPARSKLNSKLDWYSWSNDADVLAAAMEHSDVVVNLVGEPISAGRLDEAHRRLVLQSRVESVQHLSSAFFRCASPPDCFFQISATGFYGDAGEAEVDERCGPGKGILSEVCLAWEGALSELRRSGLRVLVGRLGMALGKESEAWNQLLGPIRGGLGGRFASGKQWWSWIDVEDAARAMHFLIAQSDAHGVFNICSPEPVRQGDLVAAIAQRLHRPAFAQLPAFVLRALGGRVADELLLSSCRAVPRRLLELGFSFLAPQVELELERLLA
ncbi:MAG: TIGR01777 family oxidoreductase [Myxococcota bacterium]|nr:TIGR01777 family oxidoreductase [Myxococcota bacterium]